MNCKTCAKLLSDYSENSISHDLQTLVEQHLGACETCRSLLDHVRQFATSITDSLINTTGVLKLRSDIESNVVQAMEERVDVFPFQDMMRIFEELSFREKIARVFHGIKQPPESGEYKWARLQLLRLSGPVAGVVMPALVLLIGALIVALEPDRLHDIPARIAKEEIIEPLVEPEKIVDPEVEPPAPTDIIPINDTFIPSTSKETSIGPDTDFSPQPAPFDAVALIKSPVIMKGIFSNRTPGARGSALGQHGGGPNTEGPVMRALRWLKKYQESDGSWLGTAGNSPDPGAHHSFPNANTGLALLCYLAHGETPASPEFGPTVEKAIRWLIANQAKNGRWKNTDRCYADLIAGYALCEAYGMTKSPDIKKAAEKLIDVIIKSQHPSGGWDYQFQQSNRDDISVAAWCAQALKAAKMAGLQNEGLDNAMKNAIGGFKNHWNSAGHFGYTTPNDNNSSAQGSLTGAGVLCLQLLGAANAPEAKAGVQWMTQNVTFDWTNPWGTCPLYCWYYVTQGMFHSGGDTWKQWNKKFSNTLATNQIVLKGAGIDGKDIGYWIAPAGREHCKAYVYHTTLCTLMLEVYYRYLPTYQPQARIAADMEDQPPADDKIAPAKDLDINITM